MRSGAAANHLSKSDNRQLSSGEEEIVRNETSSTELRLA